MEGLNYGNTPYYDDDDEDENGAGVQEQTSDAPSLRDRDESNSHDEPGAGEDLDPRPETVGDANTPAERRALMERSTWANAHTSDEKYEPHVFEAQHALLDRMLTDAKTAGDPVEAVAVLRDSLGYTRTLSDEDTAKLLDDLAAHPHKNEANELTIHRLTELALRRADEVDVTAAVKMESRMEDPSLNGRPIHRDIRAADELRESALQAYNSGDIQTLRDIDVKYGLDIHNITDAAAERGATHWNNDPSAPNADPDEAGNYLRLRFDAWTVENGLHPVFSDRDEAERSIDQFAQEISAAYDREDDDPHTLMRTQRQQTQLEDTLKWYFFDDGTPEHLGRDLINAARLRATEDFNRQLMNSL